MADSAYPPARETALAYKKPAHGQLSQENPKFNFLHANLRVRIEHCIGILKARFQSLKGIFKAYQKIRSDYIADLGWILNSNVSSEIKRHIIIEIKRDIVKYYLNTFVILFIDVLTNIIRSQAKQVLSQARQKRSYTIQSTIKGS